MSEFARVGIVAVALLLTVTPAAVAQSTDSAAGAQVVWRRALPFTTRPLLVQDDKIFVFSGGNASALDARTGDVLWNYAGLTINEIAQQLGCACQNAAGPAGSGLYSVGGGDTLVALDPLTGDVRWSRTIGEAVASPAVASDGLVLVAGGEQQGFVIDALDDADGSLRWEIHLAERPLPGLLAWRGMVFAPLSDGTLLAVEASTGRQVWRQPAGDLPEPLAPSQLGSDGTMALRTQSAALMLNVGTGAMQWQLPHPSFHPARW
jgi:PQQ-like domain